MAVGLAVAVASVAGCGDEAGARTSGAWDSGTSGGALDDDGIDDDGGGASREWEKASSHHVVVALQRQQLKRGENAPR
jgi:transcription elongation factor